MDKQGDGAQLNQLSRLTFDAAARKWYGALGLEAIASLLAIVLSMINFPPEWELGGAILSVALLLWAYILRLLFDKQYDLAESMRRQSVYTEALNWSVGQVQLREWRRLAGSRIRKKLAQEQREADYYATGQPVGARRLIEMVAESAFYTRHLYADFCYWLWVAFMVTCLLAVLALVVAAGSIDPNNVSILVAQVVLAVVPYVLSINLLGWAIRLGRVSQDIYRIEEAIEVQGQKDHIELPEAIYLVSEYNCQVVQGIPILSTLFHYRHDEIAELWKAQQQ